MNAPRCKKGVTAPAFLCLPARSGCLAQRKTRGVESGYARLASLSSLDEGQRAFFSLECQSGSFQQKDIQAASDSCMMVFPLARGGPVTHSFLGEGAILLVFLENKGVRFGGAECSFLLL